MVTIKRKPYRMFVLVIVLCLGVLLLQGCGGSQKSKYIGTWQGSSDVKVNSLISLARDANLVVAADGTFVYSETYTGHIVGTDYGSEEFSGEWEESSDSLTLKRSDKAEVYEFKLSPDETSLMDSSDTSNVLYKINN